MPATPHTFYGPGSPAPIAGTNTFTPGSRAGNSFRVFLGYGLVRPFQRDQKQDFASAGGVALIRSCVGQILGTMCSSPTSSLQGELPWRPEFGSLLYFLKHKKGPSLEALAQLYVIDALAKWEPRVSVTQSMVSFDNDQRTLTIRIMYNIIDQNVPGNNVLVPDVDQVVDVPLAA